MKYIKGECDNRKIGGVVIMEEAGQLKINSEMRFLLSALNDLVQGDKKAFWSNAIFVATKCDLAKPDLAGWKASMEKEIGINVCQENFVAFARKDTSEEDQNILGSPNSEEVIKMLNDLAGKATETKFDYDNKRVALVINKT